MDSFCGSKFWDWNVTWYTETPDLTPCFEKTVLVWIPSGFLLSCAGFRLLSCGFRNRNSADEVNERSFSLSNDVTSRCFTFLNIFVTFSIITLVTVNVLNIIFSTTPYFYNLSRLPPPVIYVAPAIKLLTYALTLWIHQCSHRKKMSFGGILFLFWLFSAICGVFEFQSVIRNFSLLRKYTVEDVSLILTMIEYPIVFLLFCLSFFTCSNPSKLSTSSEFKNKPSPEPGAGLPSILTFHWIWPLLNLGYKKPLEFSDLWLLNPKEQCKNVVADFYKHWKPQFEKFQAKNKRLFPLSEARRNSIHNNNQIFEDENLHADREVLIKEGSEEGRKKEASILPALWKVNWKMAVFGTFLLFISNFLMFCSPKILDLIIQHVQSDEETWKGYFYALLLLAVRTGEVFLDEHNLALSLLMGFRARSAISGAVYRKSLVISNVARKDFTTGEIVNLMSIDAQRFTELMLFISDLWCAPLQIGVCLFFLYRLLGSCVFVGLGILLVLLPLHILIGHWRENFQIKQMEFKDQRVKMMNEILSGIKVLKFYAWEISFEQNVDKVRKKELNIVKKDAYVDCFCEFVWFMAPFLVSLGTFATYVLTDSSHVLDARKAFVALNLFNMMRIPLSTLPWAVVLIIQTKVSINRLNKFLNAEEIDRQAVTHNNTNDGSAISIQKGTFSWSDVECQPCLRNINLKVPTGSLVAVVGTVGAGKSSLFSATLGEMAKEEGTVNTLGSISYVAQQAWIQNDSLRGNILFGQTFDSNMYQRIIQACALQPDLDILPGGDNTEIGEKGINLSGGQKQRIALARAIYNTADIYLLDDPLSAVDSHVGKHIFQEVIGPEGLLQGKTRIMITHGLTYLPHMDFIVVMKNGEISEMGSFQELLDKKGAFAEFLNEYLSSTDNKSEELREICSEQTEKLPVPEKVEIITETTKELTDEIPPRDHDRLIEDEKMEVGSVKSAVYFHYIKNVGRFTASFALFSFATFHGLQFASNLWLSKWSELPIVNGTQNIVHSTTEFYLGIYGVIGFSQAVFVFVACITLSLGCLSATKFLHDRMLHNVMRSPMSFFDTTPIGRIVNRFSKDVDVTDNEFPRALRGCLNTTFEVVQTFMAVIYSTPWFMCVAVPIGIAYYFVQKFYVATTRQLQRLESVLSSPVYSHFSESLSGVTTIRSFRVQKRFMKESEQAIDSELMATHSLIMCNRWLSVSVQSLGNLIAFFSAICAVIFQPNAGAVGLAITYALSVTDSLNWMVRLMSQVETNVVSIERLKEYGEFPQEAPWKNHKKEPSIGWPTRGEVIFKNFQTRYREGLDLVLKNVSCCIQPGEKVGIVGRTGAGKSSMTLSLFRIVEAAGGSIEIDGIDIATMGLHDVRGNLTIIPQDPVLFEGTLRLNLDPFETHSDAEVWRALEFAHLKEAVQGFAAGLEHNIVEGGENLSVGQRQLVCLARALLRKTKILILDEATAAVDLETDDLIQATIRSEFRDCTVLTIAHRLNTIMDYDRVMVLDKGEIFEFDSPQNLLHNTSSVFYSMAKNADIVS